MDRRGLSPLEGLLAALARPAGYLKLPAAHRQTDGVMPELSNPALEDLQKGTVTHVKTCSYICQTLRPHMNRQHREQ